jgi:hypothetical protein
MLTSCRFNEVTRTLTNLHSVNEFPPPGLPLVGRQFVSGTGLSQPCRWALYTDGLLALWRCGTRTNLVVAPSAL